MTKLTCFSSAFPVLALLALPTFAQQPLDPPLKDWPVASYWAPTAANADRISELQGLNSASDSKELKSDVRSAGIRAAVTAAGRALSFIAMTPCRVVDTRSDQGQTGAFGPPALTGGGTRSFPLPTHPTCNIPASALAYSLNFTALPATTLDFLSTWPTGGAYPGVSTLNAPQGGIVANAAIVPAGTNGSIDVVAGKATGLIIDINGYFAPTGRSISGIISSNGTSQVLSQGATVQRTGTGQYTITFPAGTFSAGSSTSYPVPIFTGIGNATVTTSNSTANVDGSGSVQVTWGVNNVATDTTFYFVIVQS